MTAIDSALLRFHAWAANARDPDSLRGQYAPDARFIRDGELVGVGHAGLRRLLEEEAKLAGTVREQVVDLDGEAVLLEVGGEEDARHACGVMRLTADEGMLTECRVDHDPVVLSRFNGGVT